MRRLFMCARRRGISSSATRSTHLEQTAHEPRVGTQAWATITRLTQLSPTTTALQLMLDNDGTGASASRFTFVPGQWVDFYIPQMDVVGGYSITSLPSELPILELAVKASAHPPAAWCTGRAKVGDKVGVRVGGSFVLRPAPSNLFVAGGVGINPLFGMLRQLFELPEGTSKAVLLYTARTRDELVFAEELQALAQRQPERTRFWLRATREPAGALDGGATAAPGVAGLGAGGRLCELDLEEALRWLGCEPSAVREGRGVPWRAESRAREPGPGGAGCATGRLGAYVCGPPRMTDETVAALRRMGVAEVYLEKWW
jgi:ferredoxin-NADP reductase